MIPKQIILVLEAKTVDVLNNELYRKMNDGWKLYNGLKVIFYGDKEYEKIYIQQVIYRRSWSDYFQILLRYKA